MFYNCTVVIEVPTCEIELMLIIIIFHPCILKS